MIAKSTSIDEENVYRIDNFKLYIVLTEKSPFYLKIMTIFSFQLG